MTSVSPEALARLDVSAASNVSCLTRSSDDMRDTTSGFRTPTASS